MPFLPVSKIKVNVTTLPQCRLPVKRRGSLPLEQHRMKSELPEISRDSRHGLFHLPRFALDSENCGRPYRHQAIIRKECLRNAGKPVIYDAGDCLATGFPVNLFPSGSIHVEYFRIFRFSPPESAAEQGEEGLRHIIHLSARILSTGTVDLPHQQQPFPV